MRVAADHQQRRTANDRCETFTDLGIAAAVAAATRSLSLALTSRLHHLWSSDGFAAAVIEIKAEIFAEPIKSSFAKPENDQRVRLKFLYSSAVTPPLKQ